MNFCFITQLTSNVPPVTTAPVKHDHLVSDLANYVTFGWTVFAVDITLVIGDVRCIWSICTFDQMCCTFGQMRKPNPNLNLTLTQLTLTQTLILTLTLTLLQVCCTTDQILSNSSNAVQLINYN